MSSTTNNSNSNENAQGRVLPEDVRLRMRAVADREASRLARPEKKKTNTLSHATRAKAAVASTPFGHSGRQQQQQQTEEWCGPFSVARQLIEQREEAKQAREEASKQSQTIAPHPMDALMEQVENDRKRKAHPSLQWKANTNPSRQSKSYYGKRQKRVQVQDKGSKVPSLFKICVDFLVDNFEHVEALGAIDSSIRRSICEELVAKNKMDGTAFSVIAETGIDALELIDCAQVTQDQLADTLKSLIPAGLRYLLLHHAGRCLGPKTVETILSIPSTLFAISISGAYLLTDAHAASLIEHTAKSLSSVVFKACPLLGSEFCKALQTQFSSYNNNSLLELSLEDLVVTKSDLLLLASSDCLRDIKTLTLRQIEAIDDEVVVTLLKHVGDGLEGLDLSFNYVLTDQSLESIRTCASSLRSLHLADLKQLTEAGLEALFTPNIPGVPAPPRLRHVHLGQCSKGVVTDTVLELILKASSMKRDKGGGTTQDVSSLGGLVYLNIQGSACTDTTMENIVSTSASTLRELDVSFSPHISDNGLGYLVSKCHVQLTKIHIWGCAQVTDNFLDGHERTDDTNLQVIGAWIKGKVTNQ